MPAAPANPVRFALFAAAPGADGDHREQPKPADTSTNKGAGAIGGPYLMLAAVLLGVGIGYALDRHHGTMPRWTAGLGLLGIAVGLYHVVREANR